MTDVNIQQVPSQQQTRMDGGPQQEPRMGDTPLDMSQFTRPSTSHSQLRSQIPAAPYLGRESVTAQQPLFPVHTFRIGTNNNPPQPKQRVNYQKSAAAVTMRNLRPAQQQQQFYIQRRGQEVLPDEGPTVKQHLQQQQKQMKEKERMVAEQRLYTDSNGGGPMHSGSDGMMRQEPTGVTKTFTVVQIPPASSAPVLLAATNNRPPPKRSRNNESGAAPSRSRKKNTASGNRQVKVIVASGVNMTTSAKQQLATAPYVVQTQPLPPTTAVPVSSANRIPNPAPPPPLARTSSFDDGLARAHSQIHRRHFSTDMPPEYSQPVQEQYPVAAVAQVAPEPPVAAQPVDLSTPSSGLDSLGTDPFLDTGNGFDDLDIIVPFNVNDSHWTFQFDETMLFDLPAEGGTEEIAGNAQPTQQQQPSGQNQFAMDQGYYGQQQPIVQQMNAPVAAQLPGPSRVPEIPPLPEDFLAPLQDPIANLLGDEVVALMGNDPLLAQADEKNLLDDFPVDLLMQESTSNANPGSPNLMSLIDWVTNDDHGLGEDGEDFVQNLRDERLENSASEFLNVCGAVQFTSVSGFENEPPMAENLPSTSQLPPRNDPTPPPALPPRSLMSEMVQEPIVLPPTTIPNTTRASSSENSTPTRSKRKNRTSPRDADKGMDRTPKVEKKRSDDRLQKQKKAEQDALEKEKEAKQHAADRERVRQIIALQEHQIQAEKSAAEAQQKAGLAPPGRNRNRNRSQAARTQRRQQSQAQSESPPSAPLVINMSPQRQHPLPNLLPVASTSLPANPPPYQPLPVVTIPIQRMSSAPQAVQHLAPHVVQQPLSPQMHQSHPVLQQVSQQIQPQVMQHSPPLPALQQITHQVMQTLPQQALQPMSQPVMETPLQPALDSVPQNAVLNHPRPQTASGVEQHHNLAAALSQYSRPPRPFSEDSGHKFYVGQDAPLDLRRTASWDSCAQINQEPALETAAMAAPLHNEVLPQMILPSGIPEEEYHYEMYPMEDPVPEPIPDPIPEPIPEPVPEQTPEAVMEDLQSHASFSEIEEAILTGSEEKLEQLLQKVTDEEKQKEFDEIPTELLWSMVENPRLLFSEEQLQQFKENFGFDIDEQVQPEDLANPEGLDEKTALEQRDVVHDVNRALILSSMILNTNEEKEEELNYMEAQVTELEKTSEEYYAIKLKILKENMHSLCYANGALVDELSRLSGRIVVTTEERKILARRLCHHQRNYIRRLQTAAKRKTEAEKKMQELLLKDPEELLPQELKKIARMEGKTTQDRPRSHSTRKKKKDTDEAAKKTVTIDDKPKATPKPRKRPPPKNEKTPRRSSVDSHSAAASRKRSRAHSDASVARTTTEALSKPTPEQMPLPVTKEQLLPPAPVQVAAAPPLKSMPAEQIAVKLRSPEPTAQANMLPEEQAGAVPTPTTPVSAANPDAPISLRKSARRSAQNINFSEMSPRSTPDPDSGRRRARGRAPRAIAAASDEGQQTPKRKRARKSSETPAKMPKNEAVAPEVPVFETNAEPLVTMPEAPSQPESEDPIKKEEAAEVPALAIFADDVPTTPKKEDEVEMKHQTTPTSEPPADQVTPTLESPLTCGGSEPQDTTTSPDTPASTESEDKGGRQMRPRRPSQLRQTADMLDLFEELDDEPVRKKRRPRTSGDTPKRQSTRTRRS